jgi:hypothetical protein
MSPEIYIGIVVLRYTAFGYLIYRLASKVNWPLVFFYLRGGAK